MKRRNALLLQCDEGSAGDKVKWRRGGCCANDYLQMGWCLIMVMLDWIGIPMLWWLLLLLFLHADGPWSCVERWWNWRHERGWEVIRFASWIECWCTCRKRRGGGRIGWLIWLLYVTMEGWLVFVWLDGCIEQCSYGWGFTCFWLDG